MKFNIKNILLLTMLLSGSFWYHPDPLWSAPKDDLQSVKKEIKTKQQLIQKTKQVETAVSTELRTINRTLSQRESELKKLDEELKKVEENISKINQEIDKTTQEARQKQVQIEKRLTSLYKAGEYGALRMLFSSESFPQMAENMRYMGSILEFDRLAFAAYSKKIEELHLLKGKLEQEAQRKEQLKKNIARKKQEIEQDKHKKSNYLSKVIQDRQSHEASLKKLQANAARLQNMLDKLEAERRKRAAAAAAAAAKRRIKQPTAKQQQKLPELPPVPDRGFASQKGRMQMPVQGNIIETFGKHKHPQFNSYTYSKGLVIAAPLGTAVRSIYDGTVIYAGYFKGYGNMIIIDHGGGYFSLYAYAANLNHKVGAEVTRGSAVAAVGDVDSAKGPALYFEIRHQGKPVDPAAWVR